MTKENIHGQVPRVEGKSLSSLGSGKAVCSEEGHKGFPVPLAHPQPSPLVCPLPPSPHPTRSHCRTSESVTRPAEPVPPLLLSET